MKRLLAALVAMTCLSCAEPDNEQADPVPHRGLSTEGFCMTCCRNWCPGPEDCCPPEPIPCWPNCQF
jgi:hypothetical protein